MLMLGSDIQLKLATVQVSSAVQRKWETRRRRAMGRGWGLRGFCWWGREGREEDAGLNHPRAHPEYSRRGTQTCLIRITAVGIDRPRRVRDVDLNSGGHVVGSASVCNSHVSSPCWPPPPPTLPFQPSSVACILEHSLLPWPPHDPLRTRIHPVCVEAERYYHHHHHLRCRHWHLLFRHRSGAPHDPWPDLCVGGCNEKINNKNPLKHTALFAYVPSPLSTGHLLQPMYAGKAVDFVDERIWTLKRRDLGGIFFFFLQAGAAALISSYRWFPSCVWTDSRLRCESKVTLNRLRTSPSRDPASSSLMRAKNILRTSNSIFHPSCL